MNTGFIHNFIINSKQDFINNHKLNIILIELGVLSVNESYRNLKNIITPQHFITRLKNSILLYLYSNYHSDIIIYNENIEKRLNECGEDLKMYLVDIIRS